MKKMDFGDQCRWLTVLMMVNLAAVEQANAQASTTIGAAATTLTSQMSNVGKLLVTLALVGGVGFAASGLMKLKEAASGHGQGQVKYSDGIWRILTGAGLAAIGAVINMASNSTGLGTVTIGNGTGW